jgi:hypothetical protein
MFVLNSDITIGKFKKVQVNEVKIKHSIYEFVNTAKLKVPISAVIKNADAGANPKEAKIVSVQTAKAIEEGLLVIIKLGYNGNLVTEFEGFVARVNPTTPTEIECEGYSYQLRKRTYPAKVFKNAKLLDVLKWLVVGTDVVLDEKNIPSFTIEKLVVNQHNGCEVLEMIKKASDNTIKTYFTGKTLYAGLVAVKVKADVKYRLGWNVIKDDNLKLRKAKNQDVVVKYISQDKSGSKKVAVQAGANKAATTSAAFGNSGETKMIKTKGITDQHSLQQMAEAKHQQLSYDGYEGKITAFGVPYCEPAYSATLIDEKYKERSGKYLIESVEVSYGMNGFRRSVQIGLKL